MEDPDGGSASCGVPNGEDRSITVGPRLERNLTARCGASNGDTAAGADGDLVSLLEAEDPLDPEQRPDLGCASQVVTQTADDQLRAEQALLVGEERFHGVALQVAAAEVVSPASIMTPRAESADEEGW